MKVTINLTDDQHDVLEQIASHMREFPETVLERVVDDWLAEHADEKELFIHEVANYLKCRGVIPSIWSTTPISVP